MKESAVDWLKKILKGQKDNPFDYDEWCIAFDQAKEMEKEEKIEFALKVYEERMKTHGGDTLEIANKLLTFKSE